LAFVNFVHNRLLVYPNPKIRIPHYIAAIIVKHDCCTVGAVLVVAGLWGWTLDRLFPADPHPYLDSCVTVLILMAQLLSALKKWDCWVAWLVVNITQIALHLSVGNVLMPIVCGLYLVNGIWSLYGWMKLYRRKA